MRLTDEQVRGYDEGGFRDNIPPPGAVRRKHADAHIVIGDTRALDLVVAAALLEIANARGLTARGPRDASAAA